MSEEAKKVLHIIRENGSQIRKLEDGNFLIKTKNGDLKNALIALLKKHFNARVVNYDDGLKVIFIKEETK